jgi:hypothetical protein
VPNPNLSSPIFVHFPSSPPQSDALSDNDDDKPTPHHPFSILSVRTSPAAPVRAVHPPGTGGLLAGTVGEGSLQLEDRAGDLVTEGGSAAVMVDWRCWPRGGDMMVVSLVGAVVGGSGCGCRVRAGFAVGEAGEEGGLVRVGRLGGVGCVVGAVGAGEGHGCSLVMCTNVGVWVLVVGVYVSR